MPRDDLKKPSGEKMHVSTHNILSMAFRGLLAIAAGEEVDARD